VSESLEFESLTVFCLVLWSKFAQSSGSNEILGHFFLGQQWHHHVEQIKVTVFNEVG